MTFSGEKFYSVGEHLEDYCENEEYQRSAVGRFYYSCYLVAREIYNIENNRKRGTSISHMDLIKYFENLEKTNEIGDKLKALRKNRNDADYELSFDMVKVQESKMISKEILNFFKKDN